MALLALTGCAGLFGGGEKDAVVVAPNERLLLVFTPFDGVVTAELQRAGVDPAALQREFESEVRYRLYARGQEEALDSVTAGVIVTVSARHWQPGYGNSGPYAAFSLGIKRLVPLTNVDPKDMESADSVAWTWQGRAKDNAPPSYAVRHLSRLAAEEVLDRVRGPRAPSEPPPPLHLMR